MDTGVPSVTTGTPGTILTQLWCADSWDILVIFPPLFIYRCITSKMIYHRGMSLSEHALLI